MWDQRRKRAHIRSELTCIQNRVRRMSDHESMAFAHNSTIARQIAHTCLTGFLSCRSHPVQTLRQTHLPISTSELLQFFMATPLDHFTTSKNKYAVCIFYRTQPMRNGDCSTYTCRLIQCPLNYPLRLRVKCGGGLVEEKKSRFPNQRTRDGYTLSLPARKLQAFASARSCEAFWKRLHEFKSVRLTACFSYFLVAWLILKTQRDVLAHRALVQCRFLLDERHVVPVSTRGHGGDVTI